MVLDNNNGALNRTTAMLVIGLALTLIGGFVGLAIAGVDTTAYVLFCAGPAVSATVGVVLSHKVGTVAETVKQVERQTNGIAIARVSSLDDHLTAQDVAAAQVATAAAELAQNTAQGRPGSTESGRPAGP
jgi:hypothetical protein